MVSDPGRDHPNPTPQKDASDPKKTWSRSDFDSGFDRPKNSDTEKKFNLIYQLYLKVYVQTKTKPDPTLFLNSDPSFFETNKKTRVRVLILKPVYVYAKKEPKNNS